MPVRLVLADDHPLILEGLQNLFRLEGDLEVVASCSNGLEVLPSVRLHRPDIVVLDVCMPGKEGIEIVREMRAGKLPARIVLLTAALDENTLLEAIHLGVEGIVLKETAPQFLMQCIRKVLAGEQWIEGRLTSQALEHMLRKEAGARELGALLTPRETEIVRMVANGLRNRAIAEKLFISEGTVKIHLHNIYEKLRIDGRMALLRFAQDKGLV